MTAPLQLLVPVKSVLYPATCWAVGFGILRILRVDFFHGMVTPPEFRGVALRKKKFFRRDFDMAPSDENVRALQCARATPSLSGIFSKCTHRVIDDSSMTRKETA